MEAPGRVRGMRRRHEPRGQFHFVLPLNLYMGPPVGGTFWFQIGPQTVAIGDQDHGRVAMPVAAVLASAVHRSLDLALGEIAPSNCQIYDVWCAFPGSRFHRGKTSLLDVE